LGDLLAESNSSDALRYFEQAVDVYERRERLGEKGDVLLIRQLAISNKGDLWRLIGNIYEDKGNWHQADEFYKRASGFYRAQGKSERDAQTQVMLGNLYRRQGQCTAALKSYDLALQRYQAGKKDKENESSITMLIKSLKSQNCN
jgi:tetratricopeptide (TPR) repeat protein